MKTVFHFAAPLVASVLLLTACGGQDPAAQPSATQSSTAGPETVPMEDQAGTGPTEDASFSSEDAGLPVTPATISCSADIGDAAARKLVTQCRAVSPATHPPCNVANSCTMIRNEIARGCALLGEDAAKTPECAIDPISKEAAADVVKRFYAGINAHDYSEAWSLWGPDGNPEQTLEEFTKGYAQTARTHVEIGKVSDVEGGAGSIYVTVPVTVDAVLNDGRRQRFSGSYALRQINRGMGPSQGWHIMSAKLSMKPA